MIGGWAWNTAIGWVSPVIPAGYMAWKVNEGLQKDGWKGALREGYESYLTVRGSRNALMTASYDIKYTVPEFYQQVMNWLESLDRSWKGISEPEFDNLWQEHLQANTVPGLLASGLLDKFTANRDRAKPYIPAITQSFDLVKRAHNDLITRINNARNTTETYTNFPTILMSSVQNGNIHLYDILGAIKEAWTRELDDLDSENGMLRNVPVIRDNAANLFYALTELQMQVFRLDHLYLEPVTFSHSAYNLLMSVDVVRHEASELMQQVTAAIPIYSIYHYHAPKCLWSQEFLIQGDPQEAVNVYNDILAEINTELISSSLASRNMSVWLDNIQRFTQAVGNFQLNYKIWYSKAENVDVQPDDGWFSRLFPGAPPAEPPPQANYLASVLQENLNGRGGNNTINFAPVEMLNILNIYDHFIQEEVKVARRELEVHPKPAFFSGHYRDEQELAAWDRQAREAEASGFSWLKQCFDRETIPLLNHEFDQAVSYERRNAALRYQSACEETSQKFVGLHDVVYDFLRQYVFTIAKVKYEVDPSRERSYIQEGLEIATQFDGKFRKGDGLSSWLGNLQTIQDRYRSEVLPDIMAAINWVMIVVTGALAATQRFIHARLGHLTWWEIGQGVLDYVVMPFSLTTLIYIKFVIEQCKDLYRTVRGLPDPSLSAPIIVHIHNTDRNTMALTGEVLQQLSQIQSATNQQLPVPQIEEVKDSFTDMPALENADEQKAREGMFSVLLNAVRARRPAFPTFRSLLDLLRWDKQSPVPIFLPDGRLWKSPEGWNTFPKQLTSKAEKSKRLSQMLMDLACLT
jgi:hypothetical protein